MIDIITHVNAVERTVGTRHVAAGEMRVVTVARSYDASLADVWDACTNPRRIPRWFLPISGDLRQGGRYQLEGNAKGTIEHCDPPHTFTASWDFGESHTWVELRLSEEGDSRTRFELDHLVPVHDERWARYGPGALGVGWDLAAVALARHLSDPATVASRVSLGMASSDDSALCITLCCEKWCIADTDDGADASAARMAAVRTMSFYIKQSSSHGNRRTSDVGSPSFRGVQAK